MPKEGMNGRKFDIILLKLVFSYKAAVKWI